MMSTSPTSTHPPVLPSIPAIPANREAVGPPGSVAGVGNVGVGRSEVAIHIEGNVPDRSELESAKTVTIGGVVEAAKVVAGENVVVGGGIVGRNACRVCAGGSIRTHFASNAELVARGDIEVVVELVNVRVWTDARLLGASALVVGGLLYARAGGEVGTLGNDAEAATRIFLGTSPVDLAEAEAIAEKTSKTRETIRITRERVQPLLSNLRRLNPAQREQATELMYKAEEAEAHIAEEEKRREALFSSPAARLVVGQSVFPGTVISLQARTVTFRKPLAGPTVFELRKIRNATEFVAVDLQTQEVQVLSSRVESTVDLLRDFEPLAKLIAP